MRNRYHNNCSVLQYCAILNEWFSARYGYRASEYYNSIKIPCQWSDDVYNFGVSNRLNIVISCLWVFTYIAMVSGKPPVGCGIKTPKTISYFLCVSLPV